MADKTYCTCPDCGHRHVTSEREIAVFKGMAISLIRIYFWCKNNNRHEFSRKDIKHLLKSDNEIARFGDWVMFGGLVYKPKGKGYFGLNMERIDSFIKNELQIPTRIWKNPITKELRKEDYRTIRQIPSLLSFLDENKMYIARYQ